MNKKSISLIILAAIIIILPFFINAGGAYEGADAMADDLISEISPGHEPWATSLWEPPSGEVESFLFAFQAALGAGFIGYFVGKKQVKNDKRS